MTKDDAPFQGVLSTQSDATVTGIKLNSTHQVEFSYNNKDNNTVEVEAVLYQKPFM